MGGEVVEEVVVRENNHERARRVAGMQRVMSRMRYVCLGCAVVLRLALPR